MNGAVIIPGTTRYLHLLIAKNSLVKNEASFQHGDIEGERERESRSAYGNTRVGIID